jgi:hypothetical protein
MHRVGLLYDVIPDRLRRRLDPESMLTLRSVTHRVGLLYGVIPDRLRCRLDPESMLTLKMDSGLRRNDVR